MSNFYIADTHINHANCLRFDNRPFSTVEEMNEALITNWNSVVTNNDVVYILGDWIWGKVNEQYLQIAASFNGNKVLIVGNHDPKQIDKGLRNGTRIVELSPLKEIVEEDGSHIILCHYPMPFFRCNYRGDFYMFCGHVHTSKEDTYLEDLRRTLRENCYEFGDNLGQIVNVGCMKPYMNYTPQKFETLKKVCQA